MGKLVVNEYMTLDGVIESPEEWQFPFYSPDVAEHIRSQMQGFDALLLGRKTYEIFAQFWPERRNNEFGVADQLNRLPKYVVTSSPAELDWEGSTRIKGNLEAEIRMLKQQMNAVIGIAGSGALIQSLMPTGLIDEYHLLVHPVVRGKGLRLFPNGGGPGVSLSLIAARAFSSGVVLLSYQPASKG